MRFDEDDVSDVSSWCFMAENKIILGIIGPELMGMWLQHPSI